MTHTHLAASRQAGSSCCRSPLVVRSRNQPQLRCSPRSQMWPAQQQHWQMPPRLVVGVQQQQQQQACSSRRSFSRSTTIASAVVCRAAAAGAGTDACAGGLWLLLYTKPECPLCDGLKDKLQAVIDRAAFVPGAVLAGASLEVRDISTNAAWQDAMHLSVPVLAVLDGQQQETVLPRPPPRIPADRLQQHLEACLQAAGMISTSSRGDGADGDGGGGGGSSAGGGGLPFTVVS